MRTPLVLTTLATLAAASVAPAFALAQSLDNEVARPPRVTTSEPTPAPSAAPAAPAVAPFDAAQYHQRATVLFGTAGLGYGSLPGINPYFHAGASLAFTVRSTFGGLLIDAGIDLLFTPTCGYSCSILSLQPSIRAGYTGAVASRVALGFRGGYAPALAVGSSFGVGLLHQLDADVHVTVTTLRGAIIEPYLGGGALIAQPVLPVGLLGLRIGAAL